VLFVTKIEHLMNVIFILQLFTLTSAALTSTYDIESLENICSICLKKYEIFDAEYRTPCEHKYHINCIDEWSRKNPTCPLCRRPLPQVEREEFDLIWIKIIVMSICLMITFFFLVDIFIYFIGELIVGVCVS